LGSPCRKQRKVASVREKERKNGSRNKERSMSE
jgi:hypothetical protein